MNRQQLVDAVGERLGDRKTAAVAVEAVLDTVTTAITAGERVALFGFGVFEKVDRSARTARNPSTGGTVEVPATSVPRFRPGQALKDAVNGRTTGTRRAARAETGTAQTADSPPAAARKGTPTKAEGKAEGKATKAKGKDSKAKESKAKESKGSKAKAKDDSKGKGRSKKG